MKSARRMMVGGLALLIAGIGMASWVAAQSNLVAAQSSTRQYTPPSYGRAQSGASRARTSQGSDQRAVAPFEERFWRYLRQAQYRNWAPLPGQSDAFYPGNSPHGAQVKLYANRPAAGRSRELPVGSILVKENFDAGGTRLMAYTVMYRAQGYAPQAGDWYWAKYEPDGTVSTMDGARVAGRVNMCIECHRSAGGNDFVFANDQ